MRRIAILIGFFFFACAPETDSPRPVDDTSFSCVGPCDAAGDIEGIEFEYVIVGSGAGGGPLAANLARAGHKVLLLEAGEDTGGNLTYQVPAYHTLSTEDASMRWDYYVNHYEDGFRQLSDTKAVCEEDGREVLCAAAGSTNVAGVHYPRAGTLGGCTAHNAMITVYPHESDWNYIAEVTGDDSWLAPDMRQYFERMERNRYVDRGTDGHGFDGWLGVEQADPTLITGSLIPLRDNDLQLTRIVASAAFAFTDATRSGTLEELVGDTEQLLGLMKRDLNVYDPARDDTEGVFTIPTATDTGLLEDSPNAHVRNGTREYILNTIREGHPLTLRLRSLVTRVLFDDELGADGRPKAVGVEFLARPDEGDGAAYRYDADPAADIGTTVPEARRVTVSREVILSAGAYNTPQLLMLSGIGPEGHVASHGVELACVDAEDAFTECGFEQRRVDLPGVGTNLQDRYEVGIVTRTETRDFDLLDECGGFGLDDSDECLAEWREGEGPYSGNGGVVGVVRRSSSASATPTSACDTSADCRLGTQCEGGMCTADPDLFVFGLPGFFKGYYPGYSESVWGDARHFTWAVLKGHTGNNAGTVRLRSSDPRERPQIDFNYFDAGSPDAADPDLEAMIDGVLFARRLIDQQNGLTIIDDLEEVFPGATVGGAPDNHEACATDPDCRAEIGRFVQREAWGHHASCTAPMGRDRTDGSVLDSRFNVHDVSSLRVVDASVFPRIPGFFIVVPVYMVSEKATDVILADAVAAGTIDG